MEAKLAPFEAEHEVATVKWMFDAYADTDANSRSIASDMNRRGIKTRSGITWQCQSVRVVLRNPVYIGMMIYGANPQGRFNRVGEQALRAWYAEAKQASWSTPAAIKAQYAHASILRDSRVVFNICGNEYRLVVKINYDFYTIYIRFIGTHREYDQIDAQTI